MIFADGSIMDDQLGLYYSHDTDGLWYVHTVFDMGDEWHICLEPVNVIGFLSHQAAQCWARDTFEIENDA
jgi:hypothetical protein